MPDNHIEQMRSVEEAPSIGPIDEDVSYFRIGDQIFEAQTIFACQLLGWVSMRDDLTHEEIGFMIQIAHEFERLTSDHALVVHLIN